MSKLVSSTFIIFLLLAATDARAGMLHTRRFSMLDVHNAGAPIALGTVVALRATSTSVRDVVLELRVKRLFPGKEPEWTSWTPGAVVKVPLYGGVEWVDPNVSPLEHRVFGHVDVAKAGDDVIVVFDIHSGQAQMIAATPARLRAATIIYDAAARAQYAEEPRARLEADLADDHLVMLALAALERHGGPSTEALLRMRWDLRAHRFAEMDGAARKRFFADVARLARKDRAVLQSLQSYAFSDVNPASIAEVAEVAALLDPARKEDFDAMRALYAGVARLVEDPASTVDLTPLASFVVAYSLRRASFAERADPLPRMTSHMSQQARVAVARALLAAVHTSSEARSRSEPIDWFLLDEATRLLVESPTPSILPVLATVDPSAERSTRGQSDILAAIARIGAAVIEVSPSSKNEVTRIVDAARAKAPRASLSATALTATRTPAQEQTVTIGYGEQLRLQNGTEINHLSDTPLITASCDPGSGGSGGGSLSYTSSTGYREWWACGYLMHIDDEPNAQKRIRIRAQPMAIVPAKMSFDAARALAEKALEGRGCTGSSSTEQDSDRGWLRYTTTGSGAKCSVLMGMYSRKVIQVDAPALKPAPPVAPK